jgi:hypothetical protein
MKAIFLAVKKWLGRIVLDFLLEDYSSWKRLIGFKGPNHELARHKKSSPTISNGEKDFLS